MADQRALQDLNRLLDRYERNPGTGGRSLRIDVSSFANQRSLDGYLATLQDAAESGGLAIRGRRGLKRNQPPVVTLGEPAALYAYLQRMPSTLQATRFLEGLATGISEPWLLRAMGEVAETWSLRRDWYGLAAGDEEGARRAAALALAIVAGRHQGLDYRSLSVAVAGDSKFLEDHEAAVVRIISNAQPVVAGHPRAALSALGLDRIAIPLHLSGPVAVGDDRMPPTLPYFAIPHDCAPLVTFWRPPAYLLTVENLVSFHRHATEINAGFEGLVVFTGGQPSLSWVRSMATLRQKLPPGLPTFHWSDIDAGGLEIFRTIERSFGSVVPHLMAREVAEQYGFETPVPVVRTGQFAGSAISSLGDYLSQSGSKCLEQEMLPPQRPAF